ncbi:MAG: metallophosphoesterase [Polyangiaceae bacterium]
MNWAMRRAVLLLSVVGASILVWATFVEPGRLVTHRRELTLTNWPRELSGLRVALLSDLHVGSPHWGARRLPELVDRVNEEHPDLVLLAGDFIANVYLGTWVSPEAIAEGLSGLRAPLGVLLVLGNHDGRFDYERVSAAFEAHGMRVLENQLQMLEFHGHKLGVLGFADQMTRPQQVSGTLALLPPGVSALALVHEPDVFMQLDDRVALTLAGHTHGGQVSLPWLGPLIIPSDYGKRFAAGHVVENGRQLFVTTGIGTSKLPVRLGVPPEIAILTLR